MWWYLAVFALALVASFAIAPKQQGAKAVKPEDFDVPTADIGKEIPVVFGTCKIASANVVWYGDLRTVAIKSKGGKKG